MQVFPVFPHLFLKIYPEDVCLIMFLFQERKEDAEIMDASKRLHRVCFEDGDVKVAELRICEDQHIGEGSAAIGMVETS